MAILLLLLLLIILLPVFRAGWAIWRQMSAMRRFMNDPVGETMRQAQQRQQQQSTFDDFFGGFGQPRNQRPRRKKKFDRGVGEYIAFTEVEMTAAEREAGKKRSVTYRTEQQITDIEWEDL